MRLGGDLDVGRGEPGRLGDRLAGLLETFEVEGDRVVHLALDVLTGRAGGHAAGEIGRVRRESGVGAAFDHDQVLAFGHWSSSSPACLMMLAQVFGCKESDGLPAIVTSPGRSGCRYWRWLPRVRASSQPSASIRLIASLTFTGTMGLFATR